MDFLTLSSKEFSRIFLTLFFSLGCFAQAFFMTHDKLSKKNLKRFLGVLAISSVLLVLSLVSRSEYNTGLGDFSVLFLLVFSMMFALMFRRETLPRINEQTILSISLAFFYVFLAQYYSLAAVGVILMTLFVILLLAGAIIPIFNHKLGICIWLLFLGCCSLPFLVHMYFSEKEVIMAMSILALLPFLIPTIGVLIIAFTKYKLTTPQKNLFYGWFLFMVILIAASQIKVESLSQLGYTKTGDFTYGYLLKELTEIFLLGMVCLYLVVNAMHFVLFLEGYRSRYVDAVRIAKEDGSSGTIDEYFSDYQLNPMHSVLIILIQGGFFVLNYYSKFVQDYFVITFSLLFIPFLISKLNTPTKVEVKEDL